MSVTDIGIELPAIDEDKELKTRPLRTNLSRFSLGATTASYNFAHR